MVNPDFILLGDSHASAIGSAARSSGLNFAGGPLASGRDFYVPFCERSRGAIRFLTDDMNALHQQLCDMTGLDNLVSSELPLLCTIGSGFHIAATTALWSTFMGQQGDPEAGFLESALFHEMCMALFEPALQFYTILRDAGRRIAFVLPPQRCPETSHWRIMLAFQAKAIESLEALDCSIIDTRATTSQNGRQRDGFCKANDPIHGNDAFGAVVLQHAGHLTDDGALHR